MILKKYRLDRVCLIFLLTLPVFTLSQTDPLPTRAFFEKSAVDDIKISPDGQHIAITVSGDQDSRLSILRLINSEVLASFTTRRNQKIGEFYWVNNERIILSTQAFLGGFDTPFLTGELFALNIDNTQKYQLVGSGTGDFAAFRISQLLTDDAEHVRVLRKTVRRGSIARSRPSSYLLDIYRKPSSPGKRIQANLSRRVIGPLPWGNLYSDNSGFVRLAIANSEENIIDVRYRDSDDDEWLDISSRLSYQSGQPLDAIEFVGFDRDSGRFAYLAIGEHGTRALSLYDPESGQSEIIFQHDSFDIELRDLVYTLKRDRVIGVKLFGDMLEQYYFSDHPDTGLNRQLDATFPGELVKITSTSVDTDVAVIVVLGPQRAGDFYIFDIRANTLKPAISRSEILSIDKMAEVTPFAIRTGDGLIVHGYVTQPRNLNGPLPMVVIPHGGPFGLRDYPLFNSEAQFFAQHGYAVLQVNFRGSGGYGKAFQEAGHRQWGLGMIDDITQATDWAIQKRITQVDKICIYGGSYGAYAALISVVREQEKYQCAVGYAGVYDLTAMSRSDIPFQPGGDDYIETSIGDDDELLRGQSPVYHADQITVPIFIAHGEQDRRAPIYHARKIRDAFDEASVEYEWLIQSAEGHGFYDTENRIDLYEKMLAFFDRHLK